MHLPDIMFRSTDMPYYDFAYFLTSANSGKKHTLPATNTSYTGICPGQCASDGKGGSCTPGGETNATGSSVAGPIAVWCALNEPDEHFYDQGLGTDTISRLQYAGRKLDSDGTPFFIQSGFARPHTPWRVPQRFWDLYNTDEIILAEHKLPPSDMPGVAWQPHSFFNSTNGHVYPLTPTTPLSNPVQRLARHAYMAAVSWMDHQLGRIMDELDTLGLTKSTICVLHGDHGKSVAPPMPPNLSTRSVQAAASTTRQGRQQLAASGAFVGECPLI
jgi:arylsulfatase A-like enzyme